MNNTVSIDALTDKNDLTLHQQVRRAMSQQNLRKEFSEQEFEAYIEKLVLPSKEELDQHNKDYKNLSWFEVVWLKKHFGENVEVLNELKSSEQDRLKSLGLDPKDWYLTVSPASHEVLSVLADAD